jgi:exonuclease SbcD
MRLVALSDLHLDTPFAWAPVEVGRLRRQDLRQSLSATLTLATSVNADAVLLAGDMYEHERITPDTAAFIRRVLAEVSPVPVFVSPGNHDWFGRSSVWSTTNWSPNVHVFDSRQLSPQTLTDGFHIWGAAHHGPANTPGFLDDFEVDRGGVHVALFHGSERAGLQLEGTDKEPHAPFEAAAIEPAGLHHAIVGHFHRRREATHHTYPGNPSVLAFGEPGDGGAVIVDVNADGAVSRRWVTVSSRVVADSEVDVTGCVDRDEVLSRVEIALLGASGLVRLTLTGELSPDIELIDAEVEQIGFGKVDHLVVRRSKLQVAYDLEALREEPTVRGQFIRNVVGDPTLDEATRQRIITTGLRALDGRRDLDVG